MAQTPAGEPASTAAGIAAFLKEVEAGAGRLDAVSVFHAVRQLPYLSDGDRSLQTVLARRAGACTAKHLLLTRLLNEIGTPAAMELVDGDFATPLRGARDVPEELAPAIRDGIPDIHNIVRATVDGRSVLLDATWNDAVKPYGFRVNDAWDGRGDTEIAVDVNRMLGSAEDPVAKKGAIIDSWPEEVRARRRRFLDGISHFVAQITDRAA